MRTQVTSSDNTRLAVYSDGPSDAPVLIAVHGYPDNASVWDGIVGQLEDRYRVVRYDVRGTGNSDKPQDRASYRLPQLAADFAAVLDWAVPTGRAHLLAHDWGSVQAWHFVDDPAVASRIASFTSVSGPHLAQLRPWARAAWHRRQYGRVLRQALDSYYIALFLLPGLAELLWRAGLIDAVLGFRSPARQAGRGRSLADKLNGLQLYRANLGRRAVDRPPAPALLALPVQVLAPDRDPFVSSAVQLQAPVPFVTSYYPRPIDGGHWVVAENPELVAAATAELVDLVEYDRSSAALNAARLRVLAAGTGGSFVARPHPAGPSGG